MSNVQSGILALGTASHAYLEFDAGQERTAPELVAAIASLREPRTTMGGVNLVAGFRPELWRALAPADSPPALGGFNDDLIGAHDYAMPATQHDAVLWLSGSAYDVVFDIASEAISTLDAFGSVAEETSSWPYRHDRDLTGFIDGSENPSLIDAPEIAVIPDGNPGAGGTILLLQKWGHDAIAWESLPVADQEQVIGRTKDESVELEDKPTDSHVARTDQDRLGKIFRRNMPYGTVTDHGTMFVGFCAEQEPLAAMLANMVGLTERDPRRAHELHPTDHGGVLLRPCGGDPPRPQPRVARGCDAGSTTSHDTRIRLCGPESLDRSHARRTNSHGRSGLTMEQSVLLERLEHLSQEPNPMLVEHARERAESVQNRIADQITAFAGSMRFVYIHILWFGAWIGVGVEKYPYGLLTMIVSLEAIFLSTFVMISQNRADAKRQVIADQQWQTVKEEDRQNQELIKISNQILELTKAIHAHTSPHSNRK